jgi:hypothetical protein
LYSKTSSREKAGEVNTYFVKEQRRSQRFQLALPMALVQGSHGEVHGAGETRNVSSTGVYFVVNDRVEPGTLLQFIITLPDEISMSGPVRLLCKGKVTRVEPHDGALVGVAATIERYEFLRAT